jgi:hypothetical protein
MASKQFKGKTCTYCCAEGASATGDHVLARSFFLPEHRDNLPQVPACGHCNGEKSQLEHYLASVLPFGGNQAHAGRNIEQVAPRLAKNAALHRKLLAGMGGRWRSINGGPFQYEMSVPLEGEKLVQLLRLIVRGLAVSEFGLVLPAEHFVVEAAFLLPPISDRWEAQLAMAGETVERDLGEGTFAYRAVRSRINPEISVWRLQWFGGMHMQGAAGVGGAAYGFTGNRRSFAANALERLFRGDH